MERALTLVVTGLLTITMTHVARGRSITLPQMLNVSTGKDSTCQMGFSDTAWGKASRSYARSASGLSKSRFNAIIEDAQVFAKPIHTLNRGGTSGATWTDNIVDEDNDKCRCLIYNSESDVESSWTDSESD